MVSCIWILFCARLHDWSRVLKSEIIIIAIMTYACMNSNQIYQWLKQSYQVIGWVEYQNKKLIIYLQKEPRKAQGVSWCPTYNSLHHCSRVFRVRIRFYLQPWHWIDKKWHIQGARNKLYLIIRFISHGIDMGYYRTIMQFLWYLKFCLSCMYFYAYVYVLYGELMYMYHINFIFDP